MPPELRSRGHKNKGNIPYNLKRSDQAVISRIRIGHAKFTHTYLLKCKQQPGCIFCDCPFTLHHIFFKGRGPGINSSQSKNVEKIQLSMQLSHLSIIFENIWF